MNPLKKAYCRTFQTGLKIALPFLPYRKPKITGSVKSLPEVIRKKKMHQSADHHGRRDPEAWTYRPSGEGACRQ